jgi:DNA helicase HerA-like ATPase
MQRPVAITVEDARHHVHVIGETGTGKSTLLANLALQDAAAGRSAVVVDPKGDLVEAILEQLPDGAERRTCVIDPDDRSSAVGLNVLAGDDSDLVVDHVNAVFKRIYEPWYAPTTSCERPASR